MTKLKLGGLTPSQILERIDDNKDNLYLQNRILDYITNQETYLTSKLRYYNNLKLTQRRFVIEKKISELQALQEHIKNNISKLLQQNHD